MKVRRPRRIGPGRAQQVGGEGCRSRLAVCAADHQGEPTRQEEVAQELGQMGVGKCRVQGGLELDVAARHGIADDDKIRRRQEMVRIEAGKQVDALIPEEVAHGRIHMRVRARHPESPVPQHTGKGPHRRAAGGDDVDVGIGRQGNQGHSGAVATWNGMW